MADRFEDIRNQTRQAAIELLDAAKLVPGDLFVVGCSTSEVAGQTIGTGSSLDIAAALCDGLLSVLNERGVYLAAQCW